jgi:hypothetical protein
VNDKIISYTLIFPSQRFVIVLRGWRDVFESPTRSRSLSDISALSAPPATNTGPQSRPRADGPRPGGPFQSGPRCLFHRAAARLGKTIVWVDERGRALAVAERDISRCAERTAKWWLRSDDQAVRERPRAFRALMALISPVVASVTLRDCTRLSRTAMSRMRRDYGCTLTFIRSLQLQTDAMSSHGLTTEASEDRVSRQSAAGREILRRV